MSEVKNNPAVITAKENNGKSDIEVLSTGVSARIIPVSASLIQEVTSKIKEPKIPMWYNDDKGREEPNPNDPDYLAKLKQAETERGQAAMDAMIMFGIDLIDGVPNDKTWLKKLKFIGIEVNQDDEFELEFAYKKYIAVGNSDLMAVGRKAGITQEAISQAAKSFQR